jgi:FkbM family methyltransferase
VIRNVLQAFHTSGIRGIPKAIRRWLFHPSTHPISAAIRTVTESEGFSVIQLGAYVGNSENDPLYKTLSKRLKEINGTLILVEPVKCFFDTLVANYAGIPGVVFENVAISDQSGPATFYRLGVNPVDFGYPDWLSQLGSLKAERAKELWDRYERDEKLKEFYLNHRIEEKVHCLTFQELTRRHNLSRLDLLQMDVEGFEIEILRTIDFLNFPIRFINYESVLLNESKPAAEELVKSIGYRLVDYNQDTFCYKESDRNLIKLRR